MISIVSPVFNAAEHLESTINSLASQGAVFEQIFMDAGSQDETRAIIQSHSKRYTIRYFAEADEGIYDAVQKGFDRANGDILAWINAGDIYFPWTLNVVQSVFDRHPNIQWITGIPCTRYKVHGTASMDPFCPVYKRQLIASGWHNGGKLPCLQQESMFWRRSLWERSNGSQVLKGQGRGRGYASDFNLWRRFAQFADLRTISTVLAAFEVAPGQITEKHMSAYRQECGVDPNVKRPSRFLHRLWRFYSFVNLRQVIKVDTL